MIDEPQHNLDGSSDAETPPHEPEPLPMGQTFHHPSSPEQELPSQDLQPPMQEAMPEQAPYVSPFGQMPPPPIEQMPPAAPAGGGTGYAVPHAWPATAPAPAAPVITQPVRGGFPLRTVLLVAVPVCILAVVIAIYLFNSNTDDEPPLATPTAITKIPATGPMATPSATTLASGSGNGTLSPAGTGGGASSPTPQAAPVVLGSSGTGSAAGGASSASSATNSGLAGRWVSRQPDFYQFNADGSGSHGHTAE